ncbi:hypothetical protein [Phytohabitans kaempferiae]|uniref:Uncharacterized protein n=1 Tax=Phytohabitans kaempferiae TaxID=1620943 RepID=A0ABV6MA02_9ACTN
MKFSPLIVLNGSNSVALSRNAATLHRSARSPLAAEDGPDVVEDREPPNGGAVRSHRDLTGDKDVVAGARVPYSGNGRHAARSLCTFSIMSSRQAKTQGLHS